MTIHCPECGTANETGNRFCSACGEPLPGTGVRCPMCGTMNPVGSVQCDKCNARLVPMTNQSQGEQEEASLVKGASGSGQPLQEDTEQRVDDALEESSAETETSDDWLDQLRTSAVEESDERYEEPEPVDSVELPDWLQDLGPIGEDAKAAPDEEQAAAQPPPKQEAVPEKPPPAAEAIEGRGSPEPRPEHGGVPDWLREIAPRTAEAAPPAIQPEGAPAPAESEIPDLGQEAASEEEGVPKGPPPPPPAVSEDKEAKAAETQEWLAEVRAEPSPPAAESETPPIAPEPESGAPEPAVSSLEPAEGLAPAEVPDWLKDLLPGPGTAEAAVEQEPLETGGLLEGLRGVLAPGGAVEPPPVRESAASAEASQASLARARLLQSLLAQPTRQPQPEVHKQEAGIGEAIRRWLVAAVLLLAVGGSLMARLIMPSEDIPALTKLAGSPAADRRVGFQRLVRVRDAVRNVTAGDTVLVAFEYGPAEADELNLVAEAILRHLLDQGAHLSIVSTGPEGLTVAAGLLAPIAAEGEQSQQYTLSAYRPGGATAVPRLLADVGTRPTLLLVLTSQPTDLRWWVEQARAFHGDTLPIIAGGSAALEPAAGPYVDASAGQLAGAIHGLTGAAAYERLRGSRGQASQRLNALAAGHVAIVGLMAFGGVFYALTGLRGKEG